MDAFATTSFNGLDGAQVASREELLQRTADVLTRYVYGDDGDGEMVEMHVFAELLADIEVALDPGAALTP